MGTVNPGIPQYRLTPCHRPHRDGLPQKEIRRGALDRSVHSGGSLFTYLQISFFFLFSSFGNFILQPGSTTGEHSTGTVQHVRDTGIEGTFPTR